jgi:hypothetical protein
VNADVMARPASGPANTECPAHLGIAPTVAPLPSTSSFMIHHSWFAVASVALDKPGGAPQWSAPLATQEGHDPLDSHGAAVAARRS